MEEIGDYLYSRHVLRPQTGVRSLCPDARNLYWLAGYCRERNRGAQYLAAALALRAVDLDRYTQCRTDCYFA
jgi:hypothetical protein